MGKKEKEVKVVEEVKSYSSIDSLLNEMALDSLFINLNSGSISIILPPPSK